MLKLDEKYILCFLDHICEFYDEVCRLGFKENTEHAAWDFDNYFLSVVGEEIEFMNNPLGLLQWI